MCRSKASGGRRCTGHTTSTTAGATPASTTSATTTSASTGVPDRARTDALAAAYPAGATGWDGKPLSAVDRRLYALRDSGWKGPIDQDGYPDTTSEGAGILRRMATQRGERVDW
jgi:hypothetical protein